MPRRLLKPNAARLAVLGGLALLAAACALRPAPPTATDPPPTAERTATAAHTATAPPTATLASGLEGQVLIGPACPGPESVLSPCPDQPYAATLHVLDPAGSLVAAIDTDARGAFRVSLPPGKYVVEPQSPGGPVRAAPAAVTVAPGTFTSITITYDSGIR